MQIVIKLDTDKLKVDEYGRVDVGVEIMQQLAKQGWNLELEQRVIQGTAVLIVERE